MINQIDNKTMRVLTGTILEQLADGDKNHPLRKHITVEQAEKYNDALGGKR